MGLLRESAPMAPPTSSFRLLVVIVKGGDPELLARTLASIDASVTQELQIAVVDEAGQIARFVDSPVAPLVTIVRAGEIVSAQALLTMCETLESNPTLSMAHALWLPLDERGTISRLAHRAHRVQMKRAIPRSITHRDALLARRITVQSLPTFRIAALEDCNLSWGGTLDEALHAASIGVLAHGDGKLVSRILAGRLPRTLGAEVEPNGWLHSLRIAMRPIGTKPWTAIIPPALRSMVVRATSSLPRRYDIVVSAARMIPNSLLRTGSPRKTSAEKLRVAYVLWRYPALSETFIRREIETLRESGMHVEVIALERDDPPMSPDLLSPAGQVMYYGPAVTSKGRESVRQWFRRKPATVVKLWLFIVRRRESRVRTIWGDRDLLFGAAQLASVLEERRITHVHAPIATRHSLSAFVAARLVGARFSAEIRASELNRTNEKPAVVDRLAHADFIVANSNYIAKSFAEARGRCSLPPVHVVHEGLDLQRFTSVSRNPRSVVKLLGVGRLIETKGFIHLLHACGELRNRGHAFVCEIVGGPSDPVDTVTWLMLRRAYESLRLQDIVIFSGAVGYSSVVEAYRRADIFVLPCVRARDGAHDVTPNSLMEAMAMGLPAVTTATGAIPEIMTDGAEGIFVEPGNSLALADAIEKLMLDPQLRADLGSRAREKIATSFDAKTNYAMMASLFERAERTQ